MTVLVVDDQPDVVRGILEGVDWKKLHIDRALGAGSAEEAKGIFKTQQVDILLCDIEMPAENGIELCAWVQQHDPMVRCIILTSHAEFSCAQQALKLGASDYILQPARYEVIENALQKAMLEQWEKKSLSAYSKQAMQEEKRIAATCYRIFCRVCGPRRIQPGVCYPLGSRYSQTRCASVC